MGVEDEPMCKTEFLICLNQSTEVSFNNNRRQSNLSKCTTKTLHVPLKYE